MESESCCADRRRRGKIFRIWHIFVHFLRQFFVFVRGFGEGIWNKSGKHSAILKIYIPIDSSSLTEYTIFLFGRALLAPYGASNFEKFTENSENTVQQPY